MSAADGLRLGFQWARDEQEAVRQAKLDAWTAIEQERKRKGWAETDAANSQLDKLMAADAERLKNPQADQRLGAFYENVGLGAAGVRPPQSFGGVGNDPTVQGNAGLPAGIQPRYQAPPQTDVQPVGVSPQRQQALTALEMARATRDRQGYLNASGLLAQHDLGAQTAQIYERAMQATPEQMSRWARTFTDNSRITGKANFDPKSGMTTIAMETGAPVVLNRAQAAEYIAGLWKMKNGDPTGLDAIKGISKELGAAAKESFDALKKVTDTNNTAMNMGLTRAETARHNRVSEGNSTAELGLRRTAANKPHYVQLVDGQGQAQMVNADKLVEKDGVLQLPPGMKYPSQKTPTSPEAQQKYRDAMMELGPQPPTGTQQANEWAARKNYIDQIYGVAAQGSAFEQALQAKLQGKQNAAKAPADPRSVPPAPGTYRILQSMGRDAVVFMPDGSQYTANPDQLEKLRSYGYKQE